MECIQLADGKYLVKHFGKYESKLCFIMNEKPANERLPWRPYTELGYDLNLSNRPSFIRGTFFTSKKGTKCFRICDATCNNPPHILLRDDWGGAFSDYRGRKLEKLNNSYYLRASSHGGGIGCDYAIIDNGTKYVLSENDI